MIEFSTYMGMSAFGELIDVKMCASDWPLFAHFETDDPSIIFPAEKKGRDKLPILPTQQFQKAIIIWPLYIIDITGYISILGTKSL